MHGVFFGDLGYVLSVLRPVRVRRNAGSTRRSNFAPTVARNNKILSYSVTVSDHVHQIGKFTYVQDLTLGQLHGGSCMRWLMGLVALIYIDLLGLNSL